MNREWVLLNYKMVSHVLILASIFVFLLLLTGWDGLPYAFVVGGLFFLWMSDRLMGKSVVGEDAVMMNLLPVSAKSSVLTKVSICGLWVGLICSIPVFLALKNGGEYIEDGLGWYGSLPNDTLFIRGLPQYRYAVMTSPSALDTAVGDLIDNGIGVAQIALMMVLIPLMFFLAGCYLGVAVLVTQLYMHPVLKKFPTMVVSVIGLVVFGGGALGILMVINGFMAKEFFSLFLGELLIVGMLAGAVWFLVRAAVKKLEQGYDVI